MLQALGKAVRWFFVCCFVMGTIVVAVLFRWRLYGSGDLFREMWQDSEGR